MSWRPAITSEGLRNVAASHRLSVASVGPVEASPFGVGPETLALAQDLMVSIPEFDWSIEVDLLGMHRITVHFKGLDISTSAME